MIKRVLCCLLILTISRDMGCNALEQTSKNSLIPRSVLFAKPDKFCVQLSHDGKYVSYFARTENGVELRVDDVNTKKTMRTFPVISARNMYAYCWCYTNKHILLPEDNQGDENDHILCLNIETGEKINITPFQKSKSFVAKLSDNFPDEAIVFNNKRDAKWFDAYRINIETGKHEKVFENNFYADLIFDETFQIKAFNKVLINGDVELLNSQKEVVLKIPFEEASCTSFYNFKKGEEVLYASSVFGKDKTSLVSIDLRTKEVKTLYESERADVVLCDNGSETRNPQVPISCDPKTYEPQFVEVNYLKAKKFPLTKNISENLSILHKKFGNKEFFIQGRSTDDSHWLVVTAESDESIKYYLFNNFDKNIKFLFANREALDSYHLQKMEPVVIKSRDGLDLVCYLTRANGNHGQPTPLVAYIHGGPWYRDSYGFNSMVQWLSNRGYAVLQINYRGSTGFGKKFLNSINKNFEGVRNDIIDAINWAIDQKIADKNKIAIMGGSFGGYSTLAGLAYTPDFFCCGIDVVGPSNFITLLSSVPEYWKPQMVTWYKTVGNPEIEADIPYLKKISPLFYKDKIKKPLFVFQGANDPRVNKAESDQIVEALKKKKSPVVYVLYPDEGHGFHREENIKSYIALSEKFFAKFLGGWYEPIHEDDMKGSSGKILEGKDVLALRIKK